MSRSRLRNKAHATNVVGPLVIRNHDGSTCEVKPALRARALVCQFCGGGSGTLQVYGEARAHRECFKRQEAVPIAYDPLTPKKEHARNRQQGRRHLIAGIK